MKKAKNSENWRPARREKSIGTLRIVKICSIPIHTSSKITLCTPLSYFQFPTVFAYFTFTQSSLSIENSNYWQTHLGRTKQKIGSTADKAVLWRFYVLNLHSWTGWLKNNRVLRTYFLAKQHTHWLPPKNYVSWNWNKPTKSTTWMHHSSLPFYISITLSSFFFAQAILQLPSYLNFYILNHVQLK